MKYNISILKKTLFLFSAFLFSIHTVFAQSVTWLNSISSGVTDTASTIIVFLAGLALAYFLWGLVIFIAQSGSEQVRTEGKQKMIWGIIFLFVLVSAWGLVSLLSTLTGIGEGTAPSAPQTTY